jgi:hypothetical protein
MTAVIAALAAASLVVFVGVHLALLVALGTKTPARYRALIALVVPPLAPYWAWQGGAKRSVYLWGFALTFYTAGVALLRR